jgi:signal peptidase
VSAVRQAAMNIAFLAVVAIAGLMLIPGALGYHRYVILTGSMTGTYDRGSIVFDKPVPTASLRVGDPITYAPPPGASSHSLVTHRLFKITASKGGARVFQTKGDANKDADAWHFMLPQSTQDRVSFHVPYVGFLFELLSMRQFRIFLIGIPALLAALAVGLGMWREAGELAGPEGLPDWGKIDHGLLPSPGALGPLPAVAPARVHLAGFEAGEFAWATGPRHIRAPT